MSKANAKATDTPAQEAATSTASAAADTGAIQASIQITVHIQMCRILRILPPRSFPEIFLIRISSSRFGSGRPDVVCA